MCDAAIQAAWDNNELVVQDFVQRNPAEINSVDSKRKVSMLYNACRRGNLTMVQFLLDRGADPNQLCAANNSTPLHGAAWGAREAEARGESSNTYHSVLQLLFVYEADETIENSDGKTAMEEGPKSLRDSFRNAPRNKASFPLSPNLPDGVPADRVSETSKLIFEKSPHTHKSLGQLLQEYPAAAHARNGRSQTLLYTAALAGDCHSIKLCLAKGADVQSLNGKKKSTPLHAASHAGHIDAVKLLLAHGADSYAVNGYSCNPYQEAKNEAVKQAFKCSEGELNALRLEMEHFKLTRSPQPNPPQLHLPQLTQTPLQAEQTGFVVMDSPPSSYRPPPAIPSPEPSPKFQSGNFFSQIPSTPPLSYSPPTIDPAEPPDESRKHM
eukprot:m.65081 g.65081  ORF g.65081 m.65081 type:complete len:382 (+) comp19607_c0_seq2:86-1231(+)